MIKNILIRTNSFLTRYNSLDTPSIWTFLHRWNYEHTLVKNLLILTNKVLSKLNKYHVFRWTWISGLFGAFLGLLVTELQEIYYQIKIGYKPTTSNLVINGVLKNNGVSNKLKEALDLNVFKNRQLQYYVHQILLNQVLTPQKETIKALIRTGIHSLNEKENLNTIAGMLGSNIIMLKEPIKVNALQFLNSPAMDRIAANGIKSALESLALKQLFASQAQQQIKLYLTNQQFKRMIYEGVKKKIAF